VARDRKSSQRRRAKAQPARARPKPKPTPKPGRPADAVQPPVPADEAVLGESRVDDGLPDEPTVDDVAPGDESVIAALEPADLPVGAVPTDPPTLPPLVDDESGDVATTGEYATARERLAADRLDESDEILPAARRSGRPPAKVGGNRLTAFLRASWAELQRVQWPDRRQVGQATAVVLGFVIVAGGFLGLADLLGSDLVNAIL
jgi:preprotein translocase SecE subunit